MGYLPISTNVNLYQTHYRKHFFLSGRHRIGTHALCVQHIPNCCGALNLKPNSITLSSSLASRRPVRDQIPLHYPACDQLASRSATNSRAGRRTRQRNGIWPEQVCDLQVRAISTCRDSWNLSATDRKPVLRPGLRPG